MNDELKIKRTMKPRNKPEHTPMEWETVFHAIEHPAIILDPDHNVIAANKASLKLTGRQPEEIIGHPCYRIFHSKESKAPPEGCPMEEMLKSGRMETIDMEMEALGGWYLVSCTPILDRNGKVEKVIHIATDITERKRAEEELHKSEALYHSLFDNMLNGFAYCKMIFDSERPLDFIYLNVNNAFESLTGLKDVIGKKASDVIPGIRESDAELLEIYGKVALTGEPAKFEQYVKALQMWFSISVYSPQKEYFVAVFDVITERKEAEEALLVSEKRFRDLLESVQLLAVILDKNANIIFCNDCLLGVTGWTREEVLHKDWFDIFIPADAKEDVRSIFESAISEGAVPSVHENSISTRCGGDRLVVWNNSILRDIDGNPIGVASIGNDVTEHRKLDNQLRQSQKMEAVGLLAGGVAHDFNNILTTIIGYGQLALMKMAGDDTHRIYIEQMLDASERAARLTNDLLLFSRKQVSEKKSVDINNIILKMRNFLTRVIGEDISCETILHPGAMFVLADAHQIEQVLMNLATNARDAMPKGGVFSITTEPLRLGEEFMSMDGYGQPGVYALITVADTGQGMNETTQQRVFEPFYTTKEAGKGTGLGLAVVYSIIKQHDGYININSGPDIGTKFKILLPLTNMESEGTPDSILPVMQGEGELILVVEDEAPVRRILRIILESHGYSVIEAENGEVAVTRYRDNIEKVALVLLDVIMPVKTGGEACNAIKGLSPAAKVIFMSGYPDDIVTAKGMLEAGAEFISKPIAPDILLRKVREVLNR